MIKVITIRDDCTEGRTYRCRDASHAERLIARLKGKLPVGSSTYFRRQVTA